MSNDPNTATDAVAPVVSPSAEDPDEGRGANAEAAKYRTRLRDTETARDALQTRLDRLERADAERVAGEILGEPGDLWALGKMAELPRTDTGDLDVDAVRAAARAVAESRPVLAVRPQRIPDTGGGRRGEPETAPYGWADVINPNVARR